MCRGSNRRCARTNPLISANCLFLFFQLGLKGFTVRSELLLQLLKGLEIPGSLGLGDLAARCVHAIHRNTLEGSRKNISAHYDLGNDLFGTFLDPSMMYSCAIFPTEDATLEQASHYKNDRICRKLDLSPKDHLLEIGTGWGLSLIHI